jgi:hypothetical protein
MFVEDVKGRNNVMLDHVDEDIVMTHVGIVGFHMVPILLGQAVITLYTGTEFLEPFVEP